MIWIRLATFFFSFLLGIYYIMLIGHLMDKLKFTRRKLTFIRCMIPFYYWIASIDEPKKLKKH